MLCPPPLASWNTETEDLSHEAQCLFLILRGLSCPESEPPSFSLFLFRVPRRQGLRDAGFVGRGGCISSHGSGQYRGRGVPGEL